MTDPSSVTEFYADGFHERMELIVERILTKGKWFKNEGAKRHLTEGLTRRLLMLDHSLTVFGRLPKPWGPSLSQEVVIELNSTINSTYLNFAGALDNAAWAMAYDLELKHELSEDNNNHRRFIALFGDRFLRSVREREPSIADELDQFKTWGTELKQHRDPAAHRIPMFIPPGVVVSSDSDAHRKREAAALRVAKETGDRTALYSSITAYATLGRFLPHLIISEQHGYSEKPLFPLLSRDYDQFLSAVSIVVNHCAPIDEARVSD